MGDNQHRPCATPQSSEGSSSSSASDGAGLHGDGPDASSPASKPAIGQIHLPGQPIVSSSQHRAFDRYKLWETANMQYLAGVDMSTRWDYYIANKDGKQLAELTRNVEGLGLSTRDVSK